MPISFDELKRRLTAATSGGVLRLGPTTLDSPDLARLFREFLPGGTLDVRVHDRTDGADTVLIAGTMNWPVATQSAGVRATFSVGSDGSARAALDIRPDGSWQLKDVAPDIAGGSLDAVTLRDASATLCSPGHASAGSGGGSEATSALTLSGTLDLESDVKPLGWLRGLLPEAAAAIALHGGVDRHDGASTVAIESAPFTVGAGGEFRAETSLGLVAGPAQDGHVESAAVLRIRVGKGETGVEVTGSLPLDSSKLFLTVSPARRIGGIGDVGSLLPGRLDAILERVPGPRLFDTTGLGLDHVILVLDLDPPGVDLIAAGIGGAKDWDLLADRRLVVSGVELTLLVADPFGHAQPYGALTGTLTFAGAPFRVTTATDKTVIAQLEGGHVVDLSTFASTFMPSIPADLPAITTLEMHVGPGTAYAMTAGISGPWRIPAGHADLAVGPVLLHIEKTDRAADAKPTGRIEGWAGLFGVTLHLSDDLAGPVELNAKLPPLAIGDVLAEFVPSFIPIPDVIRSLSLDDADIDLVRDGSTYRVDLATDVRTAAVEFGTVELLVQKIGGAWEAALGFQLPDDWRLSALSQALEGLDDLRFSGTGFVLSSFDGQPGFRHIDIPLPDGKVLRGIRLASTLSLTQGGMAGVRLDWVNRTIFDGHVDHATIAAELAADLTAVDISAAIDGEFELITGFVTFRGITLTMGYQGAKLYVAAGGVFDVRVHGDTLHFTVSVTLDENGGYCAATMEGTWHDAFGVKHFDLSNVALVLGIDLEGIPTLGIAGQVDMPGFDGSLALFFDSTSGSTVLAGSFSDITLGRIAGLFLPPGTPVSLPKPVAESGLYGVPITRALGMEVAKLLDDAVGKVKADAALLEALGTSLPGLPGPCTVTHPYPAPTPRIWYVTDRTLVRTWKISEHADGLHVSLETQLYVAGPAAVKIGELEMPAGFRLDGQLRIGDFAFTLVLDGEPTPTGGFFAEANASEALDWEGILRIARGTRGSRHAVHAAAQGPFLSLATFDARSLGAQIPGRHFKLSGQVELLGEAGGDIDFTIDDDGFTGHVDAHVGEGASGAGFALDVRFASPTDFSAHGRLHVALALDVPTMHVPDTTLVLVPAFSIRSRMDADVAVTLGASGFVFAYGGSFVWQGRTVVVPHTTETVTAGDIANLAKIAERFAQRILDDAARIFSFLFADAESWVRAMKAYFGDRVAEPEKILRRQFHRHATEIAGLLHTLGYGELKVYETLAAEFSAITAVAALANPMGLGMSVTRIAVLLEPLYPDPISLGKLLVQALGVGWRELYDALEAAYDLTWSELVAILRKIF